MAELVDPQSNVSPWASGFADSLITPLSRILALRDTRRFLSLTLPATPGIPVLSETPDDCLYTAVPAAGEYTIGLSAAGEWTASGPGRLSRLASRARGLAGLWDEEMLVRGLMSGRQAFFGYAFHPDDPSGSLPNSLLRVPRLLYKRRDGRATLTLNIAPEDSARSAIDACLAAAHALAESLGPPQSAGRRPVRVDRNHAGDTWIERVRGALDSIDAGELEKVVLTRKLAVQLYRRPRLGQALAAVAGDYPACAQVLVHHGGTSFVSISPERLVSVTGNAVIADGLAGSAPRAPEREADRGLGRTLLADAKSRREHDVVVREIRRELARHGVSAVGPPEPELLRLPSVQHLWTRVRGTRPNNLHVLDLVAGLHPTPAVGGTPRREALAWLAQQGEARRGWYTGGAGWVSPAGEGTVWVLLRCAECRGTKAELYAGAGIVSSSDPDWELGETGWKLAPMLEVLALA
jgi:isochorismate synthase